MHLLRAYILAVGYDYVMLLEKNSHLDATTTLLGNAERGKVMLSSLKTRQEGTYRFFGNSNNSDLIVLLLYNPGATVTLLASPLACEQEIPQITALLNEAIQYPHGCRVTLAQTVIQTSDCLLTQAFVQTGFSKLAVLHFLEQTKHAKQIKIPSGLSFTPLTREDDELLGTILEETYVNSLDCPNIHGLRAVQDIIDGHRGADPTCTQLWSIAELENKKIGVILLNSFPKMKQTELAYVGLSPIARGNNLGNACMQHIANQISELPFSRVTLAVDSENIPAKKLYKKWNFKKIKQRLTLIKKLS